jgi:hypothetical protein
MDSTLKICVMRDGKDSSYDDIIRAERVGGNIHIELSDGSGGKHERVVTRTVLTHVCLANYIMTLASMIRDDTDPFHSVQFNFPGFPMIVYTPARLHNPDVMRTLKDAAHITSDYWFRDDPGYDAEEDSDSDVDDGSSTTSSSSSSSSSSSESTCTIDSPPLFPVHYPPLSRHIFFD